MKQFLRVTMLVCIVALFLSAWSLSGVEARSILTHGQTGQGHVSFNAGRMSSFATSSDPRGTGEFTGVAVISASDIWAVGDGLGTLTEHWNGTQWSIITSPSPGGSFNNLYGVAAVSTNNVWAVGSSANQGLDQSKTLIEHWNGSQWSIIPSPSPGTYQDKLYRVAADSATDVWAVGYTSSNAVPQTLIEHWNGTQWSIVPSPSPNSNALLRDVAAISASDAWAVGWFSSNGVPQTLIEQWNGSSWSVVASPNRILSGGSFGDSLYGVTAVSANDVWAVGNSFNSSDFAQTLIEQWNGSSWSVVASPDPGSSNNYLFGAAAVSASNVWAVGDQQTTSGGEQTLIEQWNGTQWSVVTSPNAGTGFNLLNSVATISPDQAWTVGYSINVNGPIQTLTEQWNGTTWSVVPSPDRNGSAMLTGVAAASASDIWAVGHDINGALTEYWNGAKWRFVSSPNPGQGGFLNGVAAVSADDAWAVGQYQTSSGFHTLTEYWNGTRWSVIPSPNGVPWLNNLMAVAVVSANDIWAVGDAKASVDLPEQTLTEHWNGTQWSVVPSPNPGPSGNILNGVAAVSTNDVWAVGQSDTRTGAQALLEHWNGTKWSVFTAPTVGYNSLNAVVAISTSDVWAVGFSTGGALTEHWNGSQWSVVKGPNAGSGSILNGVAATSSSDVWAVGVGSSGALTAHWNGSQWSIVTSPDPGSLGNMLNAVVAISASNAWTVGFYANNGYDTQSLVEHWNGSTWSVVTSPNTETPPTSGN